jgi:membrane-anchored protein YejM (alkaline phosphatase superfamily)
MRERVPINLVSAGVLGVGLLVVHEILLRSVGARSGSEAAYLQLISCMQCLFLVTCPIAASALWPRSTHVAAGLALAVLPLLYLDAAVRLRVGRSLASSLVLLVEAYLEGNRRLLQDAGIDPRTVLAALAALVALVAFGAWLDARLAPRRRLHVRGARASLLGVWLAMTAALAAVEAGAAHTVQASTWARFARSVPQVLGAFGPLTRASGSVRASLRRLPSDADVQAAIERLRMPGEPAPGDVYFFVVESLRRDVLGTAMTPSLSALVHESVSFDEAISGGNATQLGWYSLFNGASALHWDPDRRIAHPGAVALRVARRRGWRVEALWSASADYMGLDRFVFGDGHALADDEFVLPHDPGGMAVLDARVLAELTHRVATPHPPTVYVVSLESTHQPYVWSDDFDPPVRPYAPQSHYMKVQVDAAERQAVVNRYRDAVAYVDGLLGRFVQGLRDAGTFDRATLVVVGDHGEEFWEHGLVGHGSEPCDVQTSVALVVKPALALSAGTAWPSRMPFVSTADVWPTLLDAAGVRGDTSLLFDGQSFLRGTQRGFVSSVGGRYGAPMRSARFVLEDAQDRLELELTDPDDPFREQRLDLLTWSSSRDPMTDALTPSERFARLRSLFGPALEQTFVVRW